MSAIANRNRSYYAVKGDRKSRYNLILSFLAEYGKPISARQLALEMYQKGLIKTPERNQVHPRLNELIKMKKVEEAGTIKDEITNRSVTAYALAG